MTTAIAPTVTTVIRNDEQHEAALAEFRALVTLDPTPGTPESDRIDLLVLLIKDYESHRWPLELPDPVAAIEFCMDQRGLSRHDLIPYLGDRHAVSRVLSGKRALSMTQVRALHKGLGIPLEILMQPSVAPSSAALEPA